MLFRSWHWPLFVWLSGGRLLNGPEVVAALVLTFAVAVPSYLLIERPIRQRRWNWEFGRTGWVAAVTAPLAVAGALFLLTPDRARPHPRQEAKHSVPGQFVLRVVKDPQQREHVLDMSGLEELQAAEFHERDVAGR